MKKIIAAVAALMLPVLAFAAQPKSFGLRMGPGLEISYQHQMNASQFLEFDAGVIGFSDYPGFRLSAAYDFDVLSFELLRGEFNMFIGPGLSAGMYDKSLFAAGLMVQYGVSYAFPGVPVSIAIDTCPTLWFSADGAILKAKSLTPMFSLRWDF